MNKFNALKEEGERSHISRTHTQTKGAHYCRELSLSESAKLVVNVVVSLGIRPQLNNKARRKKRVDEILPTAYRLVLC